MHPKDLRRLLDQCERKESSERQKIQSSKRVLSKHGKAKSSEYRKFEAIDPKKDKIDKIRRVNHDYKTDHEGQFD